MKKTLSILLAAVLSLGMLAGCSASKTGAEHTVETVLNGFKTLDTEVIRRYVGSDELAASALNLDENQAALLNLMFENLSYKIISSDENGQNAVVTAEITNTDMSDLMGELVSRMFALAMTGEEITEENTVKIFREIIQTSNKKHTEKVEIELVMTNGEWEIVPNPELLNALTGGLYSGASELMSMFGG